MVGDTLTNMFFYGNYYIYYFFCKGLYNMYYDMYDEHLMVGMCLTAAQDQLS